MDVSQGRHITFTSETHTLEGALHLPDLIPAPGIVVCHPHPQYGGDMRNNVVATLCRAAVANGMVALRFNFRGVGASEGTFNNGTGEQRDVVAALDYLRGLAEVDPNRVAVAGYSFGAAVALNLNPPDIGALIAVSVPTISGPLPKLDAAHPLLLVSGDRDEYSEPAALAHFVETVGARAELVILPGVDHFWWGSDDRLAEVVSGFLSRTVPVAANH